MSLNLKVVNEPLKVDLHIHSIFSNKKDSGDLVKDGTVNNLNVLVEKLNAFKVNMAAITDHDYFSYDMYKNFKEFEGKGSLIKVLPGVEFSVGLKDDQNKIRQVHVIAIFDDSDEDKLKNIEFNVLNLKNGKIQYDLIQEQLFSESKMIEIFNRIGLNVVLIAHQKIVLHQLRLRVLI